MDLEIVILSEVREEQILRDITSIWNLKISASELIYKTETDWQLWKTYLVTKGEWGDG